jgi:hypothetical protein
MNSLLPILLGLSTCIALAGFCAFCVAKPKSVAAYARKRYLNSNKLAQKLPFANLVLKPWFPAYLRIMGLFGFMFVLVWFYAVVALFRRMMAL